MSPEIQGINLLPSFGNENTPSISSGSPALFVSSGILYFRSVNFIYHFTFYPVFIKKNVDKHLRVFNSSRPFTPYS